MLSLALSNYISFRKVKSITLPRVNWRAFYIACAIVFTIATILCAIWVNQLTNGVYLANEYERKINVLLREGKVLEAKFAESGFLGKVTARMRELNFEKTEKVQYIQILDASLARAK